MAARLEAEELLHDGFVKAWRQWQQQTRDLPDQEKPPFRFEVQKSGDRFVISTNVQQDEL